MRQSPFDSLLTRHANARHPPFLLLAFVMTLLLAIVTTPAGAVIECWVRRIERVAGCTQLVAIPVQKENQT